MQNQVDKADQFLYESDSKQVQQMKNNVENSPNKAGLVIASTFGVVALGLVAISTPFLLPALRKHCLPYVPATNDQLSNLRVAFSRHSRKGGSFLDIGSGDGRICRLASELQLYSQVHGVELNSWLVLYSRFKSVGYPNLKIFRSDLWKFPLHRYDSMCIFGVDSMMDPLEKYLCSMSSGNQQIVFACRFPFNSLKQIDEIGQGIDTVWVYKLEGTRVDEL